MKIAISATLFAAYFVFVHSAPVVAPSEQLAARKVNEPPVFPTYVWSTAKDAQDEVEARDDNLQPPPPFGTSQYGEWGWLRRKPDGTLVTKREVPPPLFDEWRNNLEARHANEPPPFSGEVGWRVRGDAKAKREVEAIPPPPFSNGDWGRRSVEDRNVEAIPPPPPFSNGDWGRRSVEDRGVQEPPPPVFSNWNWPRSAQTIPPFSPKEWPPAKRSAEGVEEVPPPFALNTWSPTKRSVEGVEEVPPPFTLNDWPDWDRRSVQERSTEAIPPLFSDGDWDVDGNLPKRSVEERATNEAPVWTPYEWFPDHNRRDVDEKASSEVAPLWRVTDGGIPGWSKRDTEGVAYPEEAPIWTTAWGINPREAEERAEPPPVFPGSDWRERREVPPPFLGRTWIDEAKRAEVAEAPPVFYGTTWAKRSEVAEAPPVFYGTTWAKREVPPPFNGEIGWRLRNPTGTEKRADAEERELPPPFDFREWNWAGKRLAEAEAKATAAKRMIPPPAGSEFNLFTGGNGWPTPRGEKRMIPPPTGSEFNLFSGGNGWPTK